MAVPLPHQLEPRAVLALLADGGARPLGRLLGADPAAVARLVGELRLAGIAIESLGDGDYRLPAPVELLDAGRIRGALPAQLRDRLQSLDIAFQVDSTSSRLLARAPPARDALNVCAAELQHAGRGRGGRSWLCAFGGSLPLSLGWSSSAATPALSLAAGLAVWRAIDRFGAGSVRLKWPNDLWLHDRKVGGVLVELRSETSGAHLVIGVGLNVSLSRQDQAGIEARGVRAASLADATGSAPSRNALAAALIEELWLVLREFEHRGFGVFHAAWSALDATFGRPVQIHRPERVVAGTARGVDADGALLLEVGGRLERQVSGEVSLRLDEDAA